MKSLRPYQYAEGDVLCRLCGKADETIDHIINNCSMLPEVDVRINTSSLRKDDIDAILTRVNHLFKVVSTFFSSSTKIVQYICLYLITL